MDRQIWSALGSVLLMGLLLAAIGTWAPQAPSVTPPPVVPSPSWYPMTLTEVIQMSRYATDREDWSGCEIMYGDAITVTCPDGWLLEVTV